MRKRPMKAFWYFSMFITYALSLILSEYLVSLMAGSEFSRHDAFLQIAAAFLGMLIFVLILYGARLAYHIVYHHFCHKEEHRPYLDFIDEVANAIDAIAKGDFDVRVSNEMFRDARHKHFAELVDKINNMALELGSMEKMRESFVSDVSHEIQSPLTSIKGFVSLLKDENLSREEREHYIAIIESESLRLSKLSENLLKLSSLDSDTATLRRSDYPLTRQLGDTVLMLEPQWSKKNIDISLRGENVSVCADSELFSQVWINLLANSIKFTPEGGKITVAVSESGDNAAVTITDSGIGMTDETASHIFERFYMADKARSRSAGGSGLGLSIVKKIVELHGGSISVESVLGKGSSFTVKIPKNKNAV